MSNNIICPQCGEILPADSKFCTRCFAQFDFATSEQNSAGSYQASPVYSQQTTQIPPDQAYSQQTEQMPPYQADQAYSQQTEQMPPSQPIPRKGKTGMIIAICAVCAIVAIVLFLVGSSIISKNALSDNNSGGTSDISSSSGSGSTDSGSSNSDASGSSGADSDNSDSNGSDNTSESSDADTSSGKATKSGNTMLSAPNTYEGDPVWNSSISRNSIVYVTFLDSLDDMPDDAWDVSAYQDGSVMAWVTYESGYIDELVADMVDYELELYPDYDVQETTDYFTDIVEEAFEEEGPYHLYIAGNGGVDAPYDCSHLFIYFRNIVNIDFNNCFYTGNTTNMEGMFYSVGSHYDIAYFVGDVSINFSGFDTSNVTNMAYMFDFCKYTAELDLSCFDTSNVEYFAGMFKDCENLQQLDLSNFDTFNATRMDEMFEDCTNLTSVDLSSFDTSSVTTMRFMFAACESLTHVNVSSFDTSGVSDMGYMFALCYSLEELDLSNFITYEVTDMDYMFRQCTSLRKLDISNFSIDNASSYSHMFEDCDSLTELNSNNEIKELAN